MAEQRYIYTMEHMTKRHADRVVLNDITLSFIPGAKIGVLGENGAGKSTLLRIMSGTDTEVEGKAQLLKGYTVDYLRKNPSSTRLGTCSTM